MKINENEPLLLEDMAAFLEGVAPRHAPYRHNDFEIRTVNMNAGRITQRPWPTCNTCCWAPARPCRSLNGEMQFGTYQSIFFIELDHPRNREVMVQVVGE